MRVVLFLLLFILTNSLNAITGKEVFEKYCWGCHHQTAVAFGPPFSQIAAKRDANTIRAMIAAPNEVSKILGYKRNAMPAFSLNEEELQAITKYILSFKPKDINGSKENNKENNVSAK